MKIADLRASGVQIFLANDGADLVVGPRAMLSVTQVDKIRKHKAELIEQLVRESGRKPGGPGTELKRLIPDLFNYPGCGCGRFASKMDAWGVSGCEENRETIVEYLVSQSSTFTKRKIGITLPKALTELVSRPVAERWVTLAIQNARKKDTSLLVDGDNKLRSVVWVYWAGGAEGEELRYSMRSVAKHVVDAADFIVCGDQPSWFAGHVISSPRIARQHVRQAYGSARFTKWIDSVRKLQAIIDDKHVTESFLWMYDDTFILRPLSIEWIATPRATGLLYHGDPEQPARRTWREVRRRTRVALEIRGLPAMDFSHHFPIVYEKQKLQQTIDEFDAHNTARVIESLYMNHHYQSPETLGRYFQYCKKPHMMWNVRPEVAVLNVGGFRASVQKLLSRVCPLACEHENDQRD